jgi:hypothetical protein
VLHHRRNQRALQRLSRVVLSAKSCNTVAKDPACE